MSASQRVVPVFCAFAQSDDAYRQQLEAHPGTFIQQGHITFWHEQKIDPGHDKASAIKTHLSEASIILLLLSADFFTSDFYTGPTMQLVWQRQQAGQAQVIPIVVRPCFWQHSPIGRLQALPMDGRPISLRKDIDEAWTQVITDVLRVIDDPSFLSTPTSPTSQAFPFLWDVPSPRNTFFVGREAVFQTLRKALVPGALTQAIAGLGGVGKTQVALEYAHRFAQDYEAVLWLQADSWEVLTSAYLQLATKVLGLREQSEAERQVDAVKQWMQTHQRWLLILDNIEQPEEVLSAFLPPRHQGSMLIKTRMREAGPQAQSVVLPVLSRYEGVLFLLRRARKIGQEASIRHAVRNDLRLAKELYRWMDGWPLALDQAGAYIAETGSSFQRYCDLYQQFLPKLLDRRQSPTDHPASVRKTFEISWQAIGGRNPLAGKALRFCAFLAPEQIPECEQQSGASHPDTATSLNFLALLYESQGRYQEAEPLYQRALAILWVLFETGITVSDLCALQVSDLDQKTSMLRVREKRGHERQVVLGQACLEHLHALLKSRSQQQHRFALFYKRWASVEQK